MRIVTLLMAVLLFPAAAHANMIVNGSFEQPPAPAGLLNQAGIAGWYAKTATPGFDVFRRLHGPASEGDQYLDLDSSANSSVLQNVTTAAGSRYQLTFAYSPTPRNAAASNGVQVYFNDALVGTFQQDGTGLTTTKWTTYTINLTATGTNSKLEFRATGPSDTRGALIDNVVMTAVAPANLIVNGNFEQPPVQSSFRNENAIAGWYTRLSQGFDVCKNYYGPSFSGQQYIDLDGYENSSILQNVATVPGTRYSLTFAYSPASQTSAASSGMQVYFNGLLVGTYQENGLSSTRWTTYSIILTPTVSNSLLEFRATGKSDRYGALVDDVVLAPL